MEGGYAFCPECGISVAPVTPVVQPRKTPNVLSMKAKILISSGLVVVLLLVGAYFLGKYLTDEQRLFERFEQTIEDGRSDKLYDMLSGSNENPLFNQKTADGIATYLKSNRESLLAVLEQLNSEAEQIKKNDARSFENDSDTAFIYLHKKNKKRWLLYNDYELKLKRYMIPVRTNFEGAEIVVDGAKAATAKDDNSVIEIGPFFPGKYEFVSIYEGEYTNLENKVIISLFPMRSYEDTVELMLEGDYVNVYSNYNAARIFINGKDIGLTVEDGQRIGPIAVDGSNLIYAEMEFPWGMMKSEVISVDSDQLELKVNALNDAVKEDIMSSTFDFASSWIQSFQERDVKPLRHVHPDRATDFTESVDYMLDNNEYYLGELRRMTFDLDSFRVNQFSEDDYTASVKAQVDNSEVFYFKDYTPDPVPEDGTNYTEYQLVYQNGQWLVSGWIPSYDVGTAHTKVYQ